MSNFTTYASGSLDSSIKLWNFNTGKLLNNLQGYQRGIWSIAFSPDGQTLASGSGDRTMRLWDVSTGNCQQNWQAHQHQVSAVAYFPDGRLLASSSSKGKVKLWQVDTRECIYSCDRQMIINRRSINYFFLPFVQRTWQLYEFS